MNKAQCLKGLIVLLAIALCAAPAFAQDAAKGAALFKRKCKGCHRLSDSTKMGPGLAGVTKRRTEPWLHRWLQDPKGMIKNGDPIAVKLKKKYKKTMRHVKAMDNEQNRKDIIAFLRENDKQWEESKR